MNTASKWLLVSALALSFAAPALAQQQQGEGFNDRTVYLVTNGKMTHMKVSDTTHAMIMKEFKPIKAGTMIYFGGGKFYMAEDKKMAGGKMMSTDIFGRDVGASSLQ